MPIMSVVNTATRSASNVGPNNRTEPSHTIAMSSSTSGYCADIADLQPAQRPRSAIHPKIGTFSYARIGRSQLGQRDGGLTTDIPAGQRPMQTFRNEPKHAPIRNANSAPTTSSFMLL